MDNDKNPYAAPTARLDDSEATVAEGVLAGRWRRLGGAIIDSIVLMIFILPIFFLLGVFETVNQTEQELVFQIGLMLIGFFIWLVVNAYLLYHHGQTVGKRLVNTKIVTLDDRQAEFSRIVLYRTLPMHAISVTPVIGNFLGLIDALFIFGSEKRCLHDYIAKTRVIMA